MRGTSGAASPPGTRPVAPGRCARRPSRGGTVMVTRSVARGMLILSRRDVVDLVPLRDCIDAVEGAFRLHAEGSTLGPGVLAVYTAAGGFHVKAAGLVGERSYFAA